MKLTTQLHLGLRLRMVRLYLFSFVCLDGVSGSTLPSPLIQLLYEV
jgi:hypothetical protein